LLKFASQNIGSREELGSRQSTAPNERRPGGGCCCLPFETSEQHKQQSGERSEVHCVEDNEGEQALSMHRTHIQPN
jgi:hypothetical protein